MFLVSLKDGGKEFSELGDIDRERHWLVPILSDGKIAFGIAISTVKEATSPISIDLKAIETVLAIFGFKELWLTLENNASSWLLVSKAFMQPVVNGVVEGINVSA